MGSSRISRWGLSLLLCCCLVFGSVGFAAVVVGSGWGPVPGPASLSTDVGVDDVTQELDDDDVSVDDESLDPTPTEDAQTTATPTPEPTATPTPTAEDDSSSTPTPTPTPSESASGTATQTPTPTPTETPGSDDDDGGPSTTDDGGADGTSENDESPDRSGDGADESDDANSTAADAESRDPSDFEEAAGGNGTTDPDDRAVPDEPDVETGEDAPEVESRSRQRMPARGPKNGTIVMSFDDGPVSTISFTRRQYGNVTVDVLAGLPQDVEPPAGDRLSTLRITVPDEVRDSPAKVMFTVDVATLEARGIPNDAVWLAHRDPETGSWERLETHVAHASDERVVYAANTPGFSLFAIQGDSSRARSLVPVQAANESGATNGTAADEAEATFLGGFGLSMGIVLFMGAVSVGTTVFGARRVSSVEIDGQDDG